MHKDADTLDIPLIERLNGSFAIPLAQRKFRSFWLETKYNNLALTNTLLPYDV